MKRTYPARNLRTFVRRHLVGLAGLAVVVVLEIYLIYLIAGAIAGGLGLAFLIMVAFATHYVKDRREPQPNTKTMKLRAFILRNLVDLTFFTFVVVLFVVAVDILDGHQGIATYIAVSILGAAVLAAFAIRWAHWAKYKR